MATETTTETTRVCTVCKKPFPVDPDHPRRKNCPSCRVELRVRHGKFVKTCECCGKRFATENRNEAFCSKECGRERDHGVSFAPSKPSSSAYLRQLDEAYAKAFPSDARGHNRGRVPSGTHASVRRNFLEQFTER